MLSLQSFMSSRIIGSSGFAGYFGARAFGVWDNRISDGEYVQRIQENRIDPYGHPGM